jgi:hypothetical protein
LFRLSIVAGFPPADKYVLADGRDASYMMLNIKLASASASCPFRQFHNKVVSEFIVPREFIVNWLTRMFIFLPFVMAQNHALSVCSFLDAHYETLGLDIAVRNYGFSCVVEVTSLVTSWNPIKRIVFPCAGVAINHCP